MNGKLQPVQDCPATGFGSSGGICQNRNGTSGIAAAPPPQFLKISFRPLGINFRESVKQLNQGQQFRVNPADDFQRFLMMLRQVGPMSDWFVVKDPVTQVAYRVQALGDVVSPADPGGDVRKDFFQ